MDTVVKPRCDTECIFRSHTTTLTTLIAWIPNHHCERTLVRMAIQKTIIKIL
ncbi:MAG: hypothetical protein O7C68_01545 [Rickettsia endosymbiont of Ixodes ricinus]|nr:hypothetical protein [Rickettsia helvetica]MCZ6884657.1 hypothetical protein [Rickettsia endosymbiont of Ixodes ricinus]MCZ6896340.1 hypothetical protein [Rickettsia endosymbiont of Ixodes ricinus]